MHMTPLRDRVETELRETFGVDRIMSWDIQSSGEYHCSVHTDDFTLMFGVDDRDSTLSSSIIFLNVEEWMQERIYLHCIYGITSYFDIYLDEDQSITNNLSKQIKALSIILIRIDSGDLTVRDLLFYYYGYNNGADPFRARRKARN
jgi:hypothetical protein